MDHQAKKFLIWSQEEGNYANFTALLEESGWECILLGSSLASITKGDYQNSLVCLAILGPVNKIFDESELTGLDSFIKSDGSLIVASSENESHTNCSNLNRVVAQFEVIFNKDCVVKPNIYKHCHPKEAMLEDFVVNRGLEDVLNRMMGSTRRINLSSDVHVTGAGGSRRHRIIYPRGCTLKVGKLSTIMMTTSKWAVPNQQAICAFHKLPKPCASRIIAIGSSAIFSDSYIELEDNKGLVKSLLDFIVNKNFPINISDAKTVEIPEPVYGPDVFRLMDTPMPCLQTSCRLPDDKSSLAHTRLFNLDNRLLPSIQEAYNALGIRYEPLTLIKPDLALSPLRPEPAIHGFKLRR